MGVANPNHLQAGAHCISKSARRRRRRCPLAAHIEFGSLGISEFRQTKKQPQHTRPARDWRAPNQSAAARAARPIRRRRRPKIACHVCVCVCLVCFGLVWCVSTCRRKLGEILRKFLFEKFERKQRPSLCSRGPTYGSRGPREPVELASRPELGGARALAWPAGRLAAAGANNQVVIGLTLFCFCPSAAPACLSTGQTGRPPTGTKPAEGRR